MSANEATPGKASTDLLVEPLSLLVRWSNAAFYDEIARRSGVGLDRSSITVLSVLRDNARIRQTDLARLLSVGRSTISRRVSMMVADGLVRIHSDESDGRAGPLSLTPRGIAARDRVAEAWTELVGELVSDWTLEEVRLFARQLDRLAGRLRASYEESEPSRSPVLTGWLFVNQIPPAH